jgi:hypothetical protein
MDQRVRPSTKSRHRENSYREWCYFPWNNLKYHFGLSDVEYLLKTQKKQISRKQNATENQAMKEATKYPNPDAALQLVVKLNWRNTK